MLITSVTLYQAIDIMGNDNYGVLLKVLKSGSFVEAYISRSDDLEFKLFVKLELDGKYFSLADQISKDKFVHTFLKKLEEVIEL